VFLAQCGAAGGAQFVGLRINALFLGGDAGIADPAAGDGGFPGLGRHWRRVLERIFERLYKSRSCL
jgi:hypothetical protein